jgi:zinc transport system substrate-binding protein
MCQEIGMSVKVTAGLILVIGAISLIAIASNMHGPQDNSRTAGKLKVTASFYPIYYFAQQIAGSLADVTNITPAGAEPHDYEPTGQQIAEISDNRLLVLNGLGLEAWGARILQDIDPNRTLVVTACEGLAPQHINEDGQDIVDPHVWLSPTLAEQMVDKIARGFVAVDPANSETYLANADGLKLKLAGLDGEFRNGLQTCSQSSIVTSHAAFGYLAATYHLHQVAITGLSPDSEPSAQQLADIAKFAKDNNVKYIFFESLVSPKLAETIAMETGAKTLVLDPIEGLSEEEIAQGKTYFTQMGSNLENIRMALQCTP